MQKSMHYAFCTLVVRSEAKPELERWAAASGSAFERLAEDMRMCALKHDATRRELMTDEERQGYQRALERLVGNRFLSLPWTTAAEEV